MLAGKEVVMPRSPRPSRWPSAVTAFALSGAVAFALLRPGAPEAGRERVPLASSGPVEVFGELARDGEGWAVRVRAVNGGDEPEGCRVTAIVTELRDSPMSRVVRAPRPLWTAEVALSVRGRAEAEAQVPVPAATAARLRQAGDAAPRRR